MIMRIARLAVLPLLLVALTSHVFTQTSAAVIDRLERPTED